MRYLLATIATLSFAFVQRSLAQAVTDEEMIGTWKIEPSSFVATSTMMPNAFPPPAFPTNFATFTMVLKQDHTFVATNGPVRPFTWPDRPQYSGTWSVGGAYPPLLSGLLGGNTNVSSMVYFHFQDMTHFLSGDQVRWWSPNRSTAPARPAFLIGPYKTNTYNLTVYLVRQ